jgi:hypothetical protein
MQKTVRLAWLCGSALPFAMLAPVVLAADPFAASVLACAAESDRDQRLDCYDRAVAGFTAKLRDGKHETAAGAPIATAPASAVAEAARAGNEPAAAGARAAVNNTPANTKTKDGAGAASLSRHLTATVSSIDYFPNHLLIHLDNNQVWEQVAEASSEPNLRPGDAVSIDKQMGSYWLSAGKGGELQVKLKESKPAP